jgi:ABC-2 type transport system ATP-binding protein
VRVFGLDPSGSEGTAVRGRCGVVPARPALYDRLTGYDHLRYCSELFEVPAALIEAQIRDAAERFGIADALPVRVGAYSTGMRARLALAWVGAGLALLRGSRAVRRERLLGLGG